MTDLPTGTVTFLFTDIEGSTKLLRELGDAYRRVQDDHAAVIREAADEADGVEIRTEGDSFFLVFRSPVSAVGAAVSAQRSLSKHDWSHGRPLQVRMGMHTGEGVLGGGDYIGIDVNRAARIAASAHGGQVLLSDATRVLVEDTLPSDIGLRDLGEHRLKDFDRPTRLFQVTAPELGADFPPPRTLEVPSNLPAQRTPFIGRSREIETLIRLLGSRQLVTLTGPGGTGKTRLAVRVASELAQDFPAGAFFVDLAPIIDPALVPATVAGTLGVREEPNRGTLDALAEHLRPQQALLIMDNFEQVLDAAPVVRRLLDEAPKLKAIVTSRAPLRLSGEQEFPVPPLALPEDEAAADPDELSRYEAVALFIERARAVEPSFTLTAENAAAVAEICERVDGLPLAIELAASRVRMLTPQAILERLDRRLPVLTTAARDIPERQRTLRATIGWSHELLSEPEQVVFRRLAIFVGGWTLEAAEEIANPNGETGIETLEAVESLGERSLLRRAETGTDLRFGMLETIREFGLERLAAAGEAEVMGNRHAKAFVRLAELAEQRLTGRESRAWLDRLEVEHDNLRAALRGAIEAGDRETGLRLGAALWRFWQVRGHLAEGRRLVEELLEMPGAARKAAVARALLAAGSLAYWQGDMEAAERRYAESLEVSRALGDPRCVAEALFNLAFPYAIGGKLQLAMQLLMDARRMFEELGDERQAAFATGSLAMAPFMAGLVTPDEIERSRALSREARGRFESIGDLFGVTLMNGITGVRALVAGDMHEAREALGAALDGNVEIGDNISMAVVLDATAVMAGRRGRHDVALRLTGISEVLKETATGEAPQPMLKLDDPRELAQGFLSPPQIEAAVEAGRGLSLEAGVELARAELATEDEG